MQIRLGRGRLTEFTADAYVIIATTMLEPVGEDGADVHNAAGSRLRERCHELAPVQPGTSVTMPAFDLTPTEWVVHLVVDPELVSTDPGAGAATYVSAIRCAEAAGARVVTMRPWRVHGTEDELYDAAAAAFDVLEHLATHVTDLALVALDGPWHSAWVEAMNDAKMVARLNKVVERDSFTLFDPGSDLWAENPPLDSPPQSTPG